MGDRVVEVVVVDGLERKWLSKKVREETNDRVMSSRHFEGVLTGQS